MWRVFSSAALAFKVSLKRSHTMEEEIYKQTLNFIADKLEEIVKLIRDLTAEKDKPLN